MSRSDRYIVLSSIHSGTHSSYFGHKSHEAIVLLLDFVKAYEIVVATSISAFGAGMSWLFASLRISRVSFTPRHDVQFFRK